MIRVALATESLDPSGMGAHMLTLARALGPGVAPVILCPDDPGCAKLRAAARAHGLALRTFAASEDVAPWLSGAVDLLHVHAGIGWEGFALSDAGRRAGLPVVRTEHLPYLLTDPDQIAAWQAEMARIDHFIAVSASAGRGFRAEGAGLLSVVRNGIFPAGPVPPAAREGAGPVLLTVARFAPQKDHPTLIHALARLARPDVTLLLVGEGEEKAAVQALVAELGLKGAVRFLGQRSDVPALMAMADLLVLPSRFEGLPLVLLEAMAAGLPVVATRAPGNDEALGPAHSFYARPGDADDLARAIAAALSGDGRAALAAQAAQARFQHEFRAERMGEETKAVYARVLSAPSRRRRKSMDKVRIAFIGAGGIAHRHLDVLAQFPDVEIAGLCDAAPGRADAPAARFGAPAFTDPRAMLDAVEADAVYVCVPPAAHGAVERQLIERGLPFFVEKPLAHDAETATALAAEVEAAGLVTAVGYHWRYLDTVEEAARLLADTPARLVAGYWLDSTPPPDWWGRRAQSGGQVVEQATHVIDLARHLVGEVTLVFGLAGHDARPAFPGLDIATATSATLAFQSGAVGNLSATCLLNWGHRVGLHLFCDGLAIELSDREIMVDTGRGRPVRHAGEDPVIREDRDFIDAVKGGPNRIRSPYGEALRSHLVACAVERSIVSGQPVTL